MKKQIFISVLLLTSSPVMADWYGENLTKNVKTSIDLDTLKKDPVTGNVSMWMKEEYKIPQSLYGRKYDKAVMLWNVDCETRRYKFDEIAFYLKKNKVNMPLDEIQITYKNAIPDTKGWDYTNAICLAWNKTHNNP